MKKLSKETIKSLGKPKNVFSLIIMVILGVGLLFSTEIDAFFKYQVFGKNISNVTTGSGLEVHFINVGQADAIVLEFPNGSKMLVDSGDVDSEEMLQPYFENRIFENGEDWVFDHYLLTHSDSDHVGGSEFVFNNCIVNEILRPKIYTAAEISSLNLSSSEVTEKDTKIYNKFVTMSEEETNENGEKSSIEFSHAGKVIVEGEVSITFLSPTEDKYSDVNDFSPIIVVEYLGANVMLTGDASSSIEKDVIESLKNQNIDVDVLKLGHHGSKTSTCDEFLEFFQPEYAIISVGEESEYGHPSPETLENLDEFGMADENIFSTFEDGDIVVSITGTDSSSALINVEATTKIAQSFSFDTISFVGMAACVLIVVFNTSNKSKKKSK